MANNIFKNTIDVTNANSSPFVRLEQNDTHIGRIVIGNSTATSATNGAQGKLSIYGTGTKTVNIVPGNVTDNLTLGAEGVHWVGGRLWLANNSSITWATSTLTDAPVTVSGSTTTYREIPFMIGPPDKQHLEFDVQTINSKAEGADEGSTLYLNHYSGGKVFIGAADGDVESNIAISSSAGTLVAYTHGTTTGNKGIWVGQHTYKESVYGTSTTFTAAARTILYANKNNNAYFNGVASYAYRSNSRYRANRFAGIPANDISISWGINADGTNTVYQTTDLAKRNLFTNTSGYCINGDDNYLNPSDETEKTKRRTGTGNKLNILLTNNGSIDTMLSEFDIFISTNGSTDCRVTINIYSGSNDQKTTIISNRPITGYSGWNHIEVPEFRYANSAVSGRYKKIEFIFTHDKNTTSPSTKGLNILAIRAYGGIGWTNASNLSADDHIYTYNGDLESTFPNKITISKGGLSITGTGSCSATLAGDSSTNNFNLYNSGNTYGVSAFYSGAGFYVRRSTTGGGFILYNSNQWTGQFYNSKLGVANTVGLTHLIIGNNLAKTTDKNAQGILRIYSQDTQYGDLKTDTLNANRTYTLPNKTGTIALVEDLSNYYNKSDSQTQHTVLAAPHDKNGPPAFRLLVAADLPEAAASASGIVSTSTQTFGGNKTFSGTLSVTGNTTLNDNLDIITKDTDKFINFYYNTSRTHAASWRLGYLGSGSGNANYFVLQSGKSSNSASTGWSSVLQIGMDNHNITVSGATSLEGALTVASGKATSLGGALTVAGATTLNGGLTVAANKATSLTGTLAVTGTTTLNNTLTVVSGKATSLGGTLTVAGNTTLKGKIIIDNTNNTNYGSSFPTGTGTVGQIYFQTIG